MPNNLQDSSNSLNMRENSLTFEAQEPKPEPVATSTPVKKYGNRRKYLEHSTLCKNCCVKPTDVKPIDIKPDRPKNIAIGKIPLEQSSLNTSCCVKRGRGRPKGTIKEKSAEQSNLNASSSIQPGGPKIATKKNSLEESNLNASFHVKPARPKDAIKKKSPKQSNLNASCFVTPGGPKNSTKKKSLGKSTSKTTFRVKPARPKDANKTKSLEQPYLNTSCCVNLCRPRFRAYHQAEIYFYEFPTSISLRRQREQWIEWICKINKTPEWNPPADAQICSLHFVNNEKSNVELSPSFVPTIASRNNKTLPITRLEREKINRYKSFLTNYGNYLSLPPKASIPNGRISHTSLPESIQINANNKKEMERKTIDSNTENKVVKKRGRKRKIKEISAEKEAIKKDEISALNTFNDMKLIEIDEPVTSSIKKTIEEKKELEVKNSSVFTETVEEEQGNDVNFDEETRKAMDKFEAINSDKESTLEKETRMESTLLEEEEEETLKGSTLEEEEEETLKESTLEEEEEALQEPTMEEEEEETLKESSLEEEKEETQTEMETVHWNEEINLDMEINEAENGHSASEIMKPDGCEIKSFNEEKVEDEKGVEAENTCNHIDDVRAENQDENTNICMGEIEKHCKATNLSKETFEASDNYETSFDRESTTKETNEEPAVETKKEPAVEMEKVDAFVRTSFEEKVENKAENSSNCIVPTAEEQNESSFDKDAIKGELEASNSIVDLVQEEATEPGFVENKNYGINATKEELEAANLSEDVVEDEVMELREVKELAEVKELEFVEEQNENINFAKDVIKEVHEAANFIENVPEEEVKEPEFVKQIENTSSGNYVNEELPAANLIETVVIEDELKEPGFENTGEIVELMDVEQEEQNYGQTQMNEMIEAENPETIIYEEKELESPELEYTSNGIEVMEVEDESEITNYDKDLIEVDNFEMTNFVTEEKDIFEPDEATNLDSCQEVIADDKYLIESPRRALRETHRRVSSVKDIIKDVETDVETEDEENCIDLMDEHHENVNFDKETMDRVSVEVLNGIDTNAEQLESSSICKMEVSDEVAVFSKEATQEEYNANSSFCKQLIEEEEKSMFNVIDLNSSFSPISLRNLPPVNNVNQLVPRVKNKDGIIHIKQEKLDVFPYSLTSPLLVHKISPCQGFAKVPRKVSYSDTIDDIDSYFNLPKIDASAQVCILTLFWRNRHGSKTIFTCNQHTVNNVCHVETQIYTPDDQRTVPVHTNSTTKEDKCCGTKIEESVDKKVGPDRAMLTKVFTIYHSKPEI